MSRVITCPDCGQQMSLPDTYSKSQGRCVKCNAVVPVPAVEIVPAKRGKGRIVALALFLILAIGAAAAGPFAYREYQKWTMPSIDMLEVSKRLELSGHVLEAKVEEEDGNLLIYNRIVGTVTLVAVLQDTDSDGSMDQFVVGLSEHVLDLSPSGRDTAYEHAIHTASRIAPDSYAAFLKSYDNVGNAKAIRTTYTNGESYVRSSAILPSGWQLIFQKDRPLEFGDRELVDHVVGAAPYTPKKGKPAETPVPPEFDGAYSITPIDPPTHDQ